MTKLGSAAHSTFLILTTLVGLTLVGSSLSACSTENGPEGSAPTSPIQGTNLAPLPSASSLHYLQTREAFSWNDGRAVRNLLIFYFSPSCPHCHDETQRIIGSIDQFRARDIQILMVASIAGTGITLDSIRSFSDSYHLTDHPEIVVVYDTDQVFVRTYQIGWYPTLILFDEQRRPLRQYTGTQSIETLLNGFDQN